MKSFVFSVFFILALGCFWITGCGSQLLVSPAAVSPPAAGPFLPTSTPTIHLTPTMTSTPTPLVQDVSQADFQKEVLDSKIPVMVDFWISWCGWCYVFDPTVTQFAQDYAGKFKVVKVELGANPGLQNPYGMWGYPCSWFFVNGQAVDKVIGAASESALTQAADRILGPAQ